MEINPVTAAYVKSLTPSMQQMDGLSAANMAAAEPQVASGAFQQILNQVVGQNVQADNDYNQKIVEFVSGQATDLHEVMIAGEKANIAFQKTMAIRNKIVDAYTTVMGMQI